MGLKCSLLGHSYGSPETEREREERGTEVVVTVRTVESCARCGERRVVNENTEVRSVAPDDDGNEPASNGVASDQSAGVQDLSDAANDVLGGDAADGPAGGVDESSAAEQEPSADANASGDDGVDLGDAPSADADDGVILTDDGEETAPERRPGEWPDSGDTRAGERTNDEAEGETTATDDDAELLDDADETGAGDTEVETTATDDDAERLDDADQSGSDDGAAETDATPWPDHDGEDEGFAAGPALGEEADVSFTGLSPEAESVETDEEVTVDPGFASTGTLDVSERADDAGGALVCPECGERTDAVGSSLRAGDICPSCHRGYLSEEDA